VIISFKKLYLDLRNLSKQWWSRKRGPGAKP